MADPLVSVLMPAYRHEAYVRAAVDSVLAQTHAHLELIVIDDASPDGTWDALQAVRDDRLRLSRHDANRGAHATLNEAMGLARGDYLAILNSDDVYAPDRLERMLAATACAGSGPVFAFTDVTFMDGTGTDAAGHPRQQDYQALCRRCDRLGPADWFLAGNPAIGTSNFFFSRALPERVGGFAPLRYTHDWDWALRATRHTRPVWLREPLLHYRVHPANTLAEADPWRHIHENSLVQARALLSLPGREGGEAAALDACRALLGNESLHPVALLGYLAGRLAGLDDAHLEALSQGPEGRWWLRELAAAAGYPEALFGSAPRLIERDAALADQATLLEERLRTITHMSGEIAHRDEALAGQATLLEERLWTIAQMSGEIAHRDEALAGQAALLEERLRTIAHMSGEIAHRDEAIAGQAALLEERMAAMDAMGREIARRDQALAEAAARLTKLENALAASQDELAATQGELAATQGELAATQGELAALRGLRLVRLALWLNELGGQVRGGGK
jgi:hypothetical protein